MLWLGKTLARLIAPPIKYKIPLSPSQRVNVHLLRKIHYQHATTRILKLSMKRANVIDLEEKLRIGLDSGRRLLPVDLGFSAYGFSGYGSMWLVGRYTRVLYDMERSIDTT